MSYTEADNLTTQFFYAGSLETTGTSSVHSPTAKLIHFGMSTITGVLLFSFIAYLMYSLMFWKKRDYFPRLVNFIYQPLHHLYGAPIMTFWYEHALTRAIEGVNECDEEYNDCIESGGSLFCDISAAICAANGLIF